MSTSCFFVSRVLQLQSNQGMKSDGTVGCVGLFDVVFVAWFFECFLVVDCFWFPPLNFFTIFGDFFCSSTRSDIRRPSSIRKPGELRRDLNLAFWQKSHKVEFVFNICYACFGSV